MNKLFMPEESDLIIGPFIKTIITLFFAPVIILIFSSPLLLAGNTVINLIAYGQIQQQLDNTTTNTNTATTVTTDNIGVKITSPTKGQQVPVGILKVEGTSTDSPTTDCQVLVILNNVKPYQPATPTGSGGQNDYSTWNYMLAPNYAIIEQGVNKITSKLSCGNDGSSANPATTAGTNNPITKWYSVNVTGTKSSIAEGQEGEEQQQQQLSNPIPLPTISSEQKDSQRKGTAAVDALPDSDIDSEGYDTFFEDPFFKDEK